MDIKKPEMSLMCKLGSIIVHIQEAFSTKGSSFDIKAIEPLIQDNEVNEWLKEMDRLALIPKKR